MEKFKLESNNSKKLIIGVSILFCAVILIIGATTAYFTQSDSKNTGNIVTTDINGTIGYSDNDDYMRGNLIPVEETDVSLFVMKNSSHSSGKYTNDDICKYQDDMYACSLYQFTIINNANVTQELMVTLNPYPNGFSNLYYTIYEGEQDKLTTESKVAKTNTHIDGTNPSTMINSVILKPQESKTYTVVFYIKNLKDIDQTNMDAGKNFGAIIRVDSITTGTYVLNAVGETCYGIESLDDGTFKLTSFNGINADGSVVGGCGVTRDDTTGYYSVTIPSSVGNNKISTIGDRVFFKKNLSSVIIPSSVQKIGNFAFWGNSNLTTLTFEGTEDRSSQLQTIGNGAFGTLGLSSITIPSSVQTIGERAFEKNTNLTSLTFIGIDDGSSQLQTIGNSAFYSSGVSSITIPSSVTTIESSAFGGNNNLTGITFAGTDDGSSQLQTIGNSAFYQNNISSLTIPGSVTTIGDGAFMNNNNMKEVIFKESTDENIRMTIESQAFFSTSIESIIIPAKVTSIGMLAFGYNPSITSLTFSGALDGTSKLQTIDIQAFVYCNLTYDIESNPLILPSSVTTMGSGVFSGNSNLKFIYYPGDTSGFDSSWVDSGVTILTELVNNNQ